MQKKERQKESAEELPRAGNFYLKRRDNAPNGIIYLHEYNEDTGEAPGYSLRTRDAAIAETILYEVALLKSKPPEKGKAPVDCLVLDAFNFYCADHAPECATERNIGYTQKLLAEDLKGMMVSDISDANGQKEKIIKPMRAMMKTFKNGTTRRRFKDVSINHHLGYIFTALEYYKGVGRLFAVPSMLARKKWGPDLEGRKRLLSDDESAALFNTAGDRWAETGDMSEWMDMVIGFGTGCRPGRAKKVRRCMVDWVHQTLNLRVPGEQMHPNKRHAIIRMCPTLMHWLKKFEASSDSDFYVARPDGTRSTSCSPQRRIARNSGVPDYIPYHRRHKASTVMMEAAISSIQKDIMMGHAPEGSGTGHNYNHTNQYHPEYLMHAAAAIEAFFQRIAPMVHYPLVPCTIEVDQPEVDAWAPEPARMWEMCLVAAPVSPPPPLHVPGVLHYNVEYSAVTPHINIPEIPGALLSRAYGQSSQYDFRRYGTPSLTIQSLTAKVSDRADTEEQ